MSRYYEDINTVTIDLIDKFVEQILEENYREIDDTISDIRYVYYGDINRFYDYMDNEFHAFPVITYTYTLSECTYGYLERNIKDIIDPVIELIRFANCTRSQYICKIVPPPLDYNYDLKRRLCVYYNGSKVKCDSIELYIGFGIVYLDE